jgi:hypothetical protein
MAHRSSPSRSFLLAPTALRGLHLDRSHTAGQIGSCEEKPGPHGSPRRISYTNFLTEPSGSLHNQPNQKRQDYANLDSPSASVGAEGRMLTAAALATAVGLWGTPPRWRVGCCTPPNCRESERQIGRDGTLRNKNWLCRPHSDTISCPGAYCAGGNRHDFGAGVGLYSCTPCRAFPGALPVTCGGRPVTCGGRRNPLASRR